MKSEDQIFDELLENLRCAVFHMSDDEAFPIIDNYIKNNPVLLEYHEKEWYYKYC